MRRGFGVTIRLSGEAAICAAGASTPSRHDKWNEPFSNNTELSRLNT
jgi:hypothetical protein